MAPKFVSLPRTTGVLYEDDKVDSEKVVVSSNSPEEQHEAAIVWPNLLFFSFVHLGCVYGLYLILTSARIETSVWTFVTGFAAGLGITAGVHRLWSHRAYKANLPLRLFLLLCNCLAHQNSVIEWARDHRVHHKYSETEADPHNRKRGFFFAHVGWLLTRKRPEVIKAAKEIDISDLQSDPFLAFQDKYYYIVMPLIGFVIPTLVPVYFWDETWNNAFYATVFRYAVSVNITWCINSAAHTWGNRPYDRDIAARQNSVLAWLTLGEGWHNYHHVFPWDYKNAELGNYALNFTTLFLDVMGIIGWAYDFKTLSHGLVESRAKTTGDGSHPVWGWGDKDMQREHIELATTIHEKIC